MSLRHPLTRWAFRPLNLNLHLSDAATTSPMLRFQPFTRRTFTLNAPPTRTIQRHRPSQGQWQRQSQWHRRAFHSTRPKSSNPNPNHSYSYQPPNQSQPQSFSQRMKTLSREYGWSALWIYLFISALDFPFCFAAVRLFGAERIGHYEHVVVEAVKGAVEGVWPGTQEAGANSEARSGEGQEESGKGEIVKIAERKKGTAEEASLWTQLALAYAIHKSLIFIRVPLTAAITPKAVKVLRQWGWDIAKGKRKVR